ncbi:MAG: hypothetical protein AAF927_28090 [Bacteroidota bacterium]
MEKNQVLQIARVSTRIFWTLLIVFYGLFMSVLLIKSFWPTSLPLQVIFMQGFEAGWGVGGLKFCLECAGPQDILLVNLSSGMKIWIAIRANVFFVLAYLMMQKVSLILEARETFYADNVQHFRQLALLAFLAFGLSTFNLTYWEGNWQGHFTIAFGPLALSIASLVLSEIFKEGQLLLEDKNSII